MSDSRLSATLRGGGAYDDAALIAAKTDCIELTDEDEDSVTSTIEALQHRLKRLAERKDEGDGVHWPADELIQSTSATEFLSYFSYGLTPGEVRYLIYCYLKSTSMSVPKALEGLTRTVHFRRKQNLDKMALFPCLISMSGFDQLSMCEELGIPFIHNLTSGKRYVDAEGRLRLEQTQMDYYNVPYDDLYAHLTTGAENPTAASLLTPCTLGDSAPALEDGASRGTNGSSRNARGAREENLGSRRNFVASLTGNDGDARRKESGVGENNNKSTSANGIFASLRAFIPFHLFDHAKDKEKPNQSEPHSRTDSFGSRSPDRRQMGGFFSSQSLSGGSHSGSFNGDDDVADDQSAANQGAVLLNPTATGEALTGNPYTLYADSLNFHGILEPIVAVITKHVPFAFHYWDRDGHPIMYCRLGGLNSKRLMRDLFALTPIDAEPRALALLFNTYALAVLWQLIRYCNRKNQQSNQIHDALLSDVQRGDRSRSASRQAEGLFRKKAPMGSCVVVVDCAGLHLHRYLYKPLIVMVKSIVSLNVRHYPELLHHAYVTNCRGMMSFSYLVIRSLLSEETRQKVTFCSQHNSASTLLENISSDLLPQELGGKCQCPGGCIPSIAATMRGAETSSLTPGWRDRQSPSMFPTESSSMEQTGDHADENELTMHRLHCTVEKLNMWPHASRTLSFAMDAHTEIIWEFAVKKQRRVTFSVVFVSAADDGAVMSLVPRRRVQSDAGHYICPSFGTVIFRWSNKRSYFRRCRVNLKVYREEQTVTSMQV
ncbi:hypothetical protein ABB37_01175 [Leptomonas pyrrhocoris]|uniref:CRAL-TRIO domain-containing protein n=1 Tax=Leptomonas pyrrhocoris TaxID=157538 RepID=A0A0M9G898_LEPPY|nr:hypothetical protein ABB37_01175 [Leptomonas pyrrhocoris]KPA84663.1 hypothetical protein ABB37_01175 [Leptomonas pyrrhocoris]|eukprot:XP_015663102.1 hypothetical protein ABB37_01175 [Leptomonas pyrrhocoris]